MVQFRDVRWCFLNPVSPERGLAFLAQVVVADSLGLSSVSSQAAPNLTSKQNEDPSSNTE